MWLPPSLCAHSREGWGGAGGVGASTHNMHIFLFKHCFGNSVIFPPTELKYITALKKKHTSSRNRIFFFFFLLICTAIQLGMK